jgi:tetratricopeptide (TPR) repeat protein
MEGGRLDDFSKAIDYFERAVTLDPAFAAGWAALADRRADAYSTFRTPSYREVTSSAHSEAERALALDPNLPEAHVALGRIAYLVDLNWDLAQRELLRALELAPNHTVALRVLSYLSGTLGRDKDQLQYAQKAIASDPLGYWNHFAAGLAYVCTGRLDDAEAELRNAVALNDHAGAIHSELARLLLVRGRPNDALAELDKETSAAWRALSLPIVLDALGRKAEADAAIGRATTDLGDGYAYQIATIYAARNDRDNAFKWLDRSYLQHDATPILLPHYPLLKNLQGDPRYTVFLRKMNLPG